ncbi:amidophosphoribosyltransferase [bacterium]
MLDKLKEECGIFGIYNNADASQITYLGLYALQHRGQESAGIAVSDGERIRNYRRMGLVSKVFNEKKLKELKGRNAIGHVRYSTTGSSIERNAQPFSVHCSRGAVAVAHNGNLTNALSLRKKLEQEGAIFQTTLDSEIIVHLLAKEKEKDLYKAIIKVLNKVEGSYSLAVLTKNEIIAARDPYGFRPLSLGKLGGSYAVSSETCAFDLINAQHIRDIEPGELVVIDEHGIKSLEIDKTKEHRHCIFEYVYFARPDSKIFDRSVQEVRKQFGRQLAREHPVQADIVIPIPDSGNYAAYGFAEQSRIPFEMGIVRNHYVGRTFIKPEQTDRGFSVKVKLNPVKEIIKGKRVVVVDDSIVRGTTSKMRMETLRQVGAKEIHLRISSPLITHSCFFGIDTPERGKLIASNHSVDEIKRFLGVDSLGYLSIKGMEQIAGHGHHFCLACFDGLYPVSIP